MLLDPLEGDPTLERQVAHLHIGLRVEINRRRQLRGDRGGGVAHRIDIKDSRFPAPISGSDKVPQLALLVFRSRR